MNGIKSVQNEWPSVCTLNTDDALLNNYMTGLLLRNKAVHNVNAGAHWSISLLFSLVQDLIPHYDVLGDRLDGMRPSHLLKPV
jgi:hypothetical protein